MSERPGLVRIKRASGEIEETSVVVTQETGGRDAEGRLAIDARYDPIITLKSGDEILEMPGVRFTLTD